MRRLLCSLLTASVAVTAFGVAGAGAMVPEPPAPLDDVAVDQTTAAPTPTPVCDPMNDSDVALEIAWLKHEIAQLEAREKAIRADIHERSKVTAALQGQIDSAQIDINNRRGPRQDALARLNAAKKAYAIYWNIILELLAEGRQVSAAIDFARLRLAELESQLFETCHDQPAPPLQPELLH